MDWRKEGCHVIRTGLNKRPFGRVSTWLPIYNRERSKSRRLQFAGEICPHISLHWIALHYIILHWIILNCMVLRWRTLYYTSLHWITFSYICFTFFALPHFMLHRLPLSYIEYHCLAFIYYSVNNFTYFTICEILCHKTLLFVAITLYIKLGHIDSILWMKLHRFWRGQRGERRATGLFHIEGSTIEQEEHIGEPAQRSTEENLLSWA